MVTNSYKLDNFRWTLDLKLKRIEKKHISLFNILLHTILNLHRPLIKSGNFLNLILEKVTFLAQINIKNPNKTSVNLEHNLNSGNKVDLCSVVVT